MVINLIKTKFTKIISSLNAFGDLCHTANSVLCTLICLFSLTGDAQAQSSDLLSASAKTEFEKDNYVPCITELTAIITREPNNDKAYGERARCHIFKADGDLRVRRVNSKPEKDLAYTDAEKAVSLNPKNINGLMVRGLVYWYRLEHDKAIADYDKILEIDPKSVKAYSNRANAKIGRKDYAGAIADLSKIVEIDPTRAVNIYSGQAQIRIDFIKDFDGAIADYTKIIEIDPKNVNAYLKRAEIKRRNGVKYDQIIGADFSKIYQIDPKNLQMFTLAGEYCLEDKGDGAMCAGYFKEAIELVPENPMYHDYYAQSVLSIGREPSNITELRNAAVSYLQKDLEAGNKRENTYQYLGRLYGALKNAAKAEELFAKWIAVNPKEAFPFAMRGDYYGGLKDFDKAIADYTQAIALSPAYAGAYRSRGVVFNNKGDIEKAIADYTKAIELDAGDGITYLSRGNAYFVQKNYPSALADLNRAVEMKAADDCLLLYRGRIYLETGDPEAGKSDFNKTYGCSLRDFYEGEYYSRRGDWGSAIYHYERALNDYAYRKWSNAPVIAALNRAQQSRQNSSIKNSSAGASDDSQRVPEATKMKLQQRADVSNKNLAYTAKMQELASKIKILLKEYDDEKTTDARSRIILDTLISNSEQIMTIATKALAEIGNELGESDREYYTESIEGIKKNLVLYRDLKTSPR